MKYVTESLLWRNKNYSRLFLGQFISFFGTMVTSVALPYQIYHETHSTLMVGLLSLSQLIPLLFTALWGGVLADRHHQKNLLLIAEILLTLSALFLMLNAALAKPSIAILFVVATFASAVSGLQRPAMNSILQQIVAKDDFASVGANMTFNYSFCMIVGPGIAGLIIAHFGLLSAYSVDFFSFFVSFISILFIKGIKKPEVTSDQSTFAALKEGMRYAWSRQDLMGTYFVDFFAMIFGMPQALFPAIAHMHGGVKVLGWLYSAPAVGALVVSAYGGWTKKIKRHGAAVVIAALMWGVSIIFFGLINNIYIGLIFLALAGAFDAISGLFRMVIWGQTIPNEFRGRLSGIEMISYLSGPKLGDTEAGLVAAAFGVTFSVVSGGFLCIACVLACSYFLPQLWRYQASDESP